MARQGVLVVGSANMDMVVGTERFPRPGETVLGRSFAMFPGGKGANQAVACAKLGGNVTFVGKMGRDVFRDRLLASMRNDGVKLRRVTIDPRLPTGIAVITVDASGQNQIMVASGSNMALMPADIDRHSAAFGEAAVLLVQLETPMQAVLRAVVLARKKKLIVILNPAPARALPRKLLSLVDFLTPNEHELSALAGMTVTGLASAERAARKLIAVGVKNVIVTLGAKGCMIVTTNGSRVFPARSVKVVDTTAAGDAFNGALAFGLAAGLTPEAALPFANSVAALSVTRRGAQSSMPTMRDVRSFMRRAR
jgi:ribokinase